MGDISTMVKKVLLQNLQIQNLQIQNLQTKHKTSKYRGVYWHKGAKKWMVRIGNKDLGVYKSEKNAAIMYDLWASYLFGKFAYLNFGGKY